jgi:hypothetical protein
MIVCAVRLMCRSGRVGGGAAFYLGRVVCTLTGVAGNEQRMQPSWYPNLTLGFNHSSLRQSLSLANEDNSCRLKRLPLVGIVTKVLVRELSCALYFRKTLPLRERISMVMFRRS